MKVLLKSCYFKGVHLRFLPPYLTYQVYRDILQNQKKNLLKEQGGEGEFSIQRIQIQLYIFVDYLSKVVISRFDLLTQLKAINVHFPKLSTPIQLLGVRNT